jgi:uncharacterized protein YdhG (YjbR/CyaY superfamily)
MKKNFSKGIDRYIATFPAVTRQLLLQMRKAIQQAAPGSAEKMSYGIPTFTLHGSNLVHFAGYKNHIGFYPGSSGIAQFSKHLSVYKSAKGSVQFPIHQPLPLGLVKKIVQFRVEESAVNATVKKVLKHCPNGHAWYKSSDCPVCPACEKERKPTAGFLVLLAAPARRALENAGLTTLKKLASCSETSVLALHGMGPASMPILRKALAAGGLSFKK